MEGARRGTSNRVRRKKGAKRGLLLVEIWEFVARPVHSRSLNCPNIWGDSASPSPTQTAGGGSHYATEEEESPFAGKYPYSSVREQKGRGAKKSRRQYCALPSSFHGVTLGRRRKDHPWISLSYAAQRHLGELRGK